MPKLQIKKISTVDFVLSTDTSIGPGADYTQYLATMDESHLHLTAVPVRLVLRPIKPDDWSHAAQQTGVDMATLANLSVDLVLFRAVARLAIAGVKDNEGGTAGLLEREGGRPVATWELIESLESADCVNIAMAAMKLASDAAELPKS